MKRLAALPLAAILALGVTTGAHAFKIPYEALAEVGQPDQYEGFRGHPHDPCHGMMSGTHVHAECGTRTGGPVGGLT